MRRFGRLIDSTQTASRVQDVGPVEQEPQILSDSNSDNKATPSSPKMVGMPSNSRTVEEAAAQPNGENGWKEEEKEPLSTKGRGPIIWQRRLRASLCVRR